MPSSTELTALFERVHRPLSSDDIERILNAMRGWGTLETALLAASHDYDPDSLLALTAYRAALEEDADPAVLVARLNREAASFNRLEERARADAASYFGRAIHREQRGDSYGAELRKQGEAAERTADSYQEKATAKRELAGDIQARSSNLAALVSVVTPPQFDGRV